MHVAYICTNLVLLAIDLFSMQLALNSVQTLECVEGANHLTIGLVQLEISILFARYLVKRWTNSYPINL